MSRPLLLLSSVTTLAIALPMAAHADPRAFQDPATATWGGWSRGATGTLFAGWNVFDCLKCLVDSTPDLGRHNIDTAVLIANNPGAFMTGSRNIYSFTDVNDFDVIVVPQSLGTGLFTVAVQIAVLGNDMSAQSLLLNGRPWTSRTVLATGSSGFGDFTGGVDNEYLFLWSNFERVSAVDVFALEWNAQALHNSLDVFSIDVGPAPALPPPAPLDPVVVPIPGALGLFAAALGLLGRRRLEGRLPA